MMALYRCESYHPTVENIGFGSAHTLEHTSISLAVANFQTVAF